ncbi:MAG TPA: ABC transporter permease [Candidatus Binatia bacterium]|jgi:ABC-2 type transport system permease protein|nr:ABC transporter permease [Candidatus Binatia bacterium]
MRYVWIICLKDLRQRLRDRTALMVAVVVPLVLTALMGFALGGSQGFRMRLAIADLDGSELLRAFIAFAERPSLKGVVYINRTDPLAATEATLTSGNAECAVVLQPGFGEATRVGRSAPIEILAANDHPFATHMTTALVRDFLNRVTATADGARDIPSVFPLSPGGHLRTVDFFAASMAVLFLTFTVLSGVRALQSEIDSRTIVRLMAAPAAPVAILAGKFAALLILGLVQMSVMIAATLLLFGTTWGNPLPVAALVGTSVLMAIGLTAFFMSLAENAEQGQGLASIIIFLLAIVGGQFLPPQGLPDVFETLNRLTPNGQAFLGFTDLAAAAGTGSLGTILESLLVTGGVGLVGIVFAASKARAALQRAM